MYQNWRMRNADILKTSFTSKRFDSCLKKEKLYITNFRLNKLLNRYTIMLKGFRPSNDGMNAIIESEQGQNRNLGVALARNNVWCNVSFITQFFLRF